ncbi:intein N-terminal splicing region [Chitinophaga sp. CF118]|uniref:Hint domain-containing protein n=1 Tax=Chitinophaga sp. CF118 TaxID=1884367 RepID=UPI0008E2BD7A|nr:Hint domain-containing protein [Chitinophaga sp. CF118]SFD21105.1 intein N-terminal splicing region [Chitinophaga sp. CF118]
MKKYILSLLFACIACQLWAQTRPLRLEEYEKAKTFTVKDLDKDTYVKFSNAYILDRYEMRKPYVITGDDNLKKRIDLYRLVAKDSMLDIGTVIFYTNEKGKLFTAVMPLFNSNASIWEKYFEDIHAIDKEEKNFVLKLSYVLSKEFSFQLYKAINGGKDLKTESGTYGTDICFPGDQLVTLADGSQKTLRNIVTGDKITTLDAVTHQTSIVSVKELVVHTPKNYAITQLLVMNAVEKDAANIHMVTLSGKVLKATPNHPVQTVTGKKQIGEVVTGDELLCMDENTKTFRTYIVVNKTESAGGLQPVYNIVTDAGNTFIMNEVMVLQK